MSCDILVFFQRREFTMNILVTGARAPATMDMMRTLINHGYSVYSAESMHYPIGRFVKGLSKHFVVPKPNNDLHAYLNAVKKIIINYKIDLLIPTCEEIFHISQGHEDFSKYTRVFCEPFSTLHQLHDKYAFNQLVLSYGLNAPESWLINSAKDKEHLPQNEALVLKPIFSRFGSKTIIKPTQKTIEKLPVNVPYIAQRFITGKEYSTYTIAHEGTILVQSCYHSKYVAGRSTGIYFIPAEIKLIDDFIKHFCERHHFSGQIAFDFIISDNKVYVLECNPRITSGFHLIADCIDWPALLNNGIQKNTRSDQSLMLGQGMVIHSLKYLSKAPKIFIKDYQRAHDVLKNEAYPWLGLKSTLTMMNVIFRAIKVRKNFYPASTYDIDFDGVPEQ